MAGGNGYRCLWPIREVGMSEVGSYIENIPVELIRVSGKQLRRLSPDRVARHVAAGDFRPIDLIDCGDFFVIGGNGRHRYFAAISMGWRQIPAFVSRG